MRKFLNFQSIFWLLLGAIFVISCEPDTPNNNELLGPSVTLNSPSAYTVAPGEEVTVDFGATVGDSPLNAFTIYENGTKIALDRIKVDGVTPGDAAVLLVGDERNGFSNKMVTIVAQAEAGTTVTYEIAVVDEKGKSESLFVDITTVGTPPVISTSSPVNFDSEPSVKNTVRISVSNGSGRLSSIEVRENGDLLDAGRLDWDSFNPDTNPFDVQESEKDGFTDKALYITTPDTEGLYQYDVIAIDEYGLKDTLTFMINVVMPSTPVDMLTGVLLNQAGPDGTGGLDLDTGKGTGSMDSEAEIVDKGIDENLPLNQNWKKNIAGINDTEVKYLRPGENGLPESFTFDGVESKEEVAASFANGVDFASSISSTVKIGDMFVAQRDGKTYIFLVTDLVETPDDNSDYYEFSIKF